MRIPSFFGATDRPARFRSSSRLPVVLIALLGVLAGCGEAATQEQRRDKFTCWHDLPGH